MISSYTKYVFLLIALILFCACKQSQLITKRVYRSGYYLAANKPKMQKSRYDGINTKQELVGENSIKEEPIQEKKNEQLTVANDPVENENIQNEKSGLNIDLSEIDFNASTKSITLTKLHKIIQDKAKKLLDEPTENKPDNEATGFYFYLGLWVVAVVLCFYLYPLAGWLLLVIGIILLALLIWMIIVIGKAIRDATRNAARGCGNAGRSCSRCG